MNNKIKNNRIINKQCKMKKRSLILNLVVKKKKLDTKMDLLKSDLQKVLA